MNTLFESNLINETETVRYPYGYIEYHSPEEDEREDIVYDQAFWEQPYEWMMLDYIHVDNEQRGRGRGQRMMTDFLSKFNNYAIILEPAPEEGGEEGFNRLVKWYKSLGFVQVTPPADHTLVKYPS